MKVITWKSTVTSPLCKIQDMTFCFLEPSQGQQQDASSAAMSHNNGVPASWCLAPSLPCPGGIPPPPITHWAKILRKPIHVWEQVMHFDGHVASKGLWKHSGRWWQVLHLQEQNKSPPWFHFHFLHWISKLWNSDNWPHEGRQLSTSLWLILEKPDTSKRSSRLPCLEPWGSVQSSQAFMCSAGKEYLVHVYLRIVDDVPCSARHQIHPHRSALLCVMLGSVPATPHAQKAWVRAGAGLFPLSKNSPPSSSLCTAHAFFSSKKKHRNSWCLLRWKVMHALSERGGSFPFTVDVNRSAEEFDKLRSRTRSFSSCWEEVCWASPLRAAPSSSSGALEESSSLVSGSSSKTGPGTPSERATGPRADSRSGYFRRDSLGGCGSFCRSQAHQ